jgi:hypothetical protein
MSGPKHKIIGFLLVGLVAMAGCAGTRIVETWNDPALKPLKFHKTAVLLIDPSQTLRRIGEDQIVRRLPAGSAVPGYLLFPDPEPGDFNRVQGRLRENEFDGAIVVRVLGVEERLNWVPGYPTTVPPYRAYYFQGPFRVDPGYYRTDQLIRVEVSLYSLPLNKLVWSGLTESFNPASPAALMAEVAETVIGELRNRGLSFF